MEAAVAIRSVRVSVVIPTLNEAENLPHVFPRLPQGLHEVIVVDGRSTDGTVEVARRLRPDVRIVMQDGKGKGNALAAGFAAATGDIFVTLDADGSTDAAEIPRFVSALCNGADFVKGSRFAQGGASSDITFTRRLGNRGAHRPRQRPLPHELHRPLLRTAMASRSRPLNVRIAEGGLVIHEVPSYERNRIHGGATSRRCATGPGFCVRR
jgi:glycosyltransferase involved in cell wall biosynthesis